MTNEVAAQADTVKGERLRHGPALREGIRDGIPIALGYLAVAFALGIAARNAGLTAFQGFVASFLNLASAGQYAGFTAIAAKAVYWEVALITLVTNARYLLMSCALSQRFAPDTPLRHRLLVGYAVTDEIFGISIARPGYVEPWYNYGAMLVAVPGWSIGTALGVLAGNILPELVVTALSVALYGTFLAVIIPPARKSKVIAGVVAVSFALSFGAARLPVVRELSGGSRVILLTLLIAGAAAVLFPVSEEVEKEEGAA